MRWPEADSGRRRPRKRDRDGCCRDHDYLGSTFENPDAAPLDEIVASVEGGLRESMRGQSRDAIEEAVRSAARQASFRFLLVLRLNEVASEDAREKGLIATLLFFWMRALDSDELVQEMINNQAGRRPAGWERWSETVLGVLNRIYVEEQARASLERDYLAGRSSLFADAERAWTETREQAEQVARIALFLAPAADHDRPASFADVDLTPIRSGAAIAAAERAAYLADIVRAHTWQLSGDQRRAARVLVTRFGLGSAVNDRSSAS